jgi:hypothetical protein
MDCAVSKMRTFLIIKHENFHCTNKNNIMYLEITKFISNEKNFQNSNRKLLVFMEARNKVNHTSVHQNCKSLSFIKTVRLFSLASEFLSCLFAFCVRLSISLLFLAFLRCFFFWLGMLFVLIFFGVCWCCEVWRCLEFVWIFRLCWCCEVWRCLEFIWLSFLVLNVKILRL